jgi:hypothetical protein
MYHDIINYFTKIKNPRRGLQHINFITGKRIMVRTVMNNKLREMVKIVDNKKLRPMVKIVQKMEKYNGNPDI